jgi:hypothetical protein
VGRIGPGAAGLLPDQSQAAQVFGHRAALPRGEHLGQGGSHILHVVGADAVFNGSHAHPVAIVDVFSCKGSVANFGQAVGTVISITELAVIDQVAVREHFGLGTNYDKFSPKAKFGRLEDWKIACFQPSILPSPNCVQFVDCPLAPILKYTLAVIAIPSLPFDNDFPVQ